MIFCKCGGEMGVTDTRVRHDGTQRRTRKCEACGDKTTTLEIEEQRYKRLVKLEEVSASKSMETMVEKVARAICVTEKMNDDDILGGWVHWRDSALAAISAMREPTKEMITGEGMHWDYSCHVCGGWKEGWYTMIDAALKA